MNNFFPIQAQYFKTAMDCSKVLYFLKDLAFISPDNSQTIFEPWSYCLQEIQTPPCECFVSGTEERVLSVSNYSWCPPQYNNDIVYNTIPNWIKEVKILHWHNQIKH